VNLDQFFTGFEGSRPLYEALYEAVCALGPVEIRVGKSQIAFVSGKAFAWAWIPARYLGAGRGAPLVLSLAFRRRDPSPRWKEIVEPARGRFTHHLELWSEAEIDAEVRAWLSEARLGS
jgi:hypothetical protein